MDEARFERDHGPLFAALRRQRGECPEPEVLAAFVEGRQAGDAGAAVAAHVALCPLCQEIVAAGEDGPGIDDVAWAKARGGLDRRSAPWQEGVRAQGGGRGRTRTSRGWAAAAAAAIGLAAGVVLWQARQPAAPTPGAATVRGAQVEILEPIGPVRRVGLFAWNPLPFEGQWRLEIEDADGGLVWEGRSAAASYRPEAELLNRLEPRRAYRWRVVAESPAGETLAESSWVEFVLMPAAVDGSSSPISR